MSLVDEHTRLRLCLGITAVESQDLVIVDGMRERRVYQGSNAVRLLPQVFRLANGANTISAISAATGLTLSTTRALATKLLRDQILEICGDEADRQAGDDFADSDAFLSRMGNGIGSRYEAGRMRAVLDNARILVFGPPHLVRKIHSDLAAMKVSSDVHADRREREIAIALDDASGECDYLQSVLDFCMTRSIPVLRVATNDVDIEVGPVFVDRVYSCLECFRRDRPLDDEPCARHDMHREFLDELICGIALAEATARITGITPSIESSTIEVYSIERGTSESYIVAPYPDCEWCGMDLHADSSGQLYEWYVGWSESGQSRFSDPSPSYAQKLRKLTRDRSERNPTRPRQALPSESEWPAIPGTDLLFAETPSGSVEMDACSLGSLLALTCGYRDGQRTRWAPSGGGMASVTAHVIIDDVFDLPGNVFTYDDTKHEVISRTPYSVSIPRLLRSCGLASDGHIVGILAFTSSVGRLRQKYGSFSLRLALLDSGCAMTQAVAIATAYGYRLDPCLYWPEFMVSLLSDDDPGTVVSLVARLSHRKLN